MPAPGGGAWWLPQACCGRGCKEAHQAVERGEEAVRAVGIAVSTPPRCHLTPLLYIFLFRTPGWWSSTCQPSSAWNPTRTMQPCWGCWCSSARATRRRTWSTGTRHVGSLTGRGSLVLPSWPWLLGSSEASCSHMRSLPFARIYEL